LSPPVFPRWARAADYLTFLIVIIALVVAASGGMKIRYHDWKFTMTSPYRLIVWAAAIALVRHFFVRQQPIYRQLPADIARWYRSTPFRAAAAAFTGTRPAIFFVGYLAIFLFGYPPGAPPPGHRHDPNEVVTLPLRWDAGWYLQIAEKGYEYSHLTGATGQQSIVFFPALPLTMRVVALLLAGSDTAFLFSGTLVSLAAFLGALVYLYLLARDHLDDEQSRGALWLLAAYPFAVFYGAIYTESIFLLGAAGAFYHMQRRELLRAGLWALVVGLTRPNGFLLSVPLAVLAISSWLPAWLVRASHDAGERGARADDMGRTSPVPALTAAAMPVVGMLMYSVFVWSLTGNPLAWMAGHLAWGRRYTGLTALIIDRYNWIAGAGLYAYVSQVPLDLLNASGVVFVLAAAWPVARRLGLAYGIFILINMLPPLAEGGMLSAGRFSSVMFPAFLWLAGAVPGRHRAGWIASFAAIQALNAALFYTWRPMF
jgi:hypothetical protein